MAGKDGGRLHSGSSAGGIHWREGELEFEQFLQLIPDAVVVADSSGRIVLANRQAEQLFGYPREELLQGTIEWTSHSIVPCSNSSRG